MKRRTTVTPAHPELVPRWCRWFGHVRHNDLVAARGGRGVYIAANPCVRAGCPGDGHVWQRVERTEPGAPGIDERCAVDGCSATRHLRPPAPAAPVASVILRTCVDTESYARAFNDGFDAGLEHVIEELIEGEYVDPDDDADAAAILRDYGLYLRQLVDDANESAGRKPGGSQ